MIPAFFESENEIAGLATASMNVSDFMEKVRTAVALVNTAVSSGKLIAILLVSEGRRQRK